MKTILISAAGTMASVSYIRHLKAFGFRVVGINAVDSPLARGFCDEFYVVPMVNDSENYIKAIERISFDVFMPWLDEEHILFAKNAVSFYERIMTSSPASILLTTNKRSTYNFCIDYNIPVAKRTEKVPAFVRQNFSRGSKDARIVYSQRELDSLDDALCIKQEILSGQEYTVDVLCSKDGRYVFSVPRKRLMAQNVSTVAEIDMQEDIIDFCKGICAKIPFRGPINIQLFKNGSDIRLVEINPRLAGTSILSISAGFDLLNDSIMNFLGENDLSKEYKVRNLSMFRYYEELYV